MKKLLSQETDRNGVPVINVDLDAVCLELEQGFGSGVKVAIISFRAGGKRVTVGLDLFQHDLKNSPTLRMITTNKSTDVIRQVQIRPWVKE